MKFYISPPTPCDCNDKDDISHFFVELSDIITEFYIDNTNKNGMLTFKNIVDIPATHIERFKTICKKYNIQFKVVQ